MWTAPRYPLPAIRIVSDATEPALYARDQLSHYLTLMWEPDATHESILDKYLESEFGAAGPALRPIFEALEDAAGELARLVPGEAAEGLPEIATGVLQPDLINVGYFMRRVGV